MSQDDRNGRPLAATSRDMADNAVTAGDRKAVSPDAWYGALLMYEVAE